MEQTEKLILENIRLYNEWNNNYLKIKNDFIKSLKSIALKLKK